MLTMAAGRAGRGCSAPRLRLQCVLPAAAGYGYMAHEGYKAVAPSCGAKPEAAGLGRIRLGAVGC